MTLPDPPSLAPLVLPCFGPTLWVPADVSDLVARKPSLFDDYEYALHPGVYLWAVKFTSGRYRVHYIGSAEKTPSRTFRKRMQEHLGHYPRWEVLSQVFSGGNLRYALPL
jgi:hypothetical protein